MRRNRWTGRKKRKGRNVRGSEKRRRKKMRGVYEI